MPYSWQNIFVSNIRVEVADKDLLEHIDEVLDWFSQHEKNASGGLSDIINEAYEEREFRARFERFIDRLVFANDYLPGNLFPDQIGNESNRQRYRKLIRVFHPDKGANHSDWLNFRAEKVNSWYAQSGKVRSKRKDHDRSSSGTKPSAENRVAGQNHRSNSRRYVRRGGNRLTENKSLTSYFRNFLGAPEVFEKRLYLMLSIAGFLLAILFILTFLLNP